MMLSSADGYCSIVVFDLGELGAVHPTQQHHRQLAAIAQTHGGSNSASATPVPHSPSVSTMRASPAPPRSERESSVASSAAVAPPLFLQQGGRAPSSASSVDQPLPTPGEDEVNASVRRPSAASSEDDGGAPKPKKRRIMLQHLGNES